MSRKDLVDEYNRMRGDDSPIQTCASCGVAMYRNSMDRHHPAGKSGTNILRYVYLCRPCHREAHHDPARANERGLLWPRRNTHNITFAQWVELLDQMKEHRLIL